MLLKQDAVSVLFRVTGLDPIRRDRSRKSVGWICLAFRRGGAETILFGNMPNILLDANDDRGSAVASNKGNSCIKTISGFESSHSLSDPTLEFIIALAGFGNYTKD